MQPAVGSATAPRDANMSLFQRLNAETGLQLPVFGTPVLGALLVNSIHSPACAACGEIKCVDASVRSAKQQRVTACWLTTE